MKKGKKRNQGFSLVEVIVSMVILAIILVPLLSQFVLSTRVNQKTRNRQYATTLGKNIVEGLKEYSFEEIAYQFHGVNGRPFYIVPLDNLSNPTQGIGYMQTNASFQPILLGDVANADELTITDANGDGTYEVRYLPDKNYYYMIKGIKEGSGIFDVRISYDASKYQGNEEVAEEGGLVISQNQYKAPSLTELDHTKTALINPMTTKIQFKTSPEGGYEYDEATGSYEILHQSSYEDKAILAFWECHKEYKERKWLEECEVIQQENRRREEEAKKNGQLPPAPIPTPALPTLLTKEQLMQKVSRNTVIQVKKKAGEESVTCYYEYQFHDAEGILRDAEGSVTVDTKRYTGFFPETSFTQLDSIYLFHIPLKRDAWYSMDPDNIMVEVDPSLTMEEKRKVFIAEQPLEGASLSAPTKVAVTGLDKVRFYYQNEFEPDKTVTAYQSYPLVSENKSSSLVDYKKEAERIYEIKVEVLEKDTENVLFTLDSTGLN